MRGSAYSELLGYIVRHQNDLIPTLTEQQKEIFEKLKDCESELRGMNEPGAFISLVFMDAIHCKVKENHQYITKAAYVVGRTQGYFRGVDR